MQSTETAGRRRHLGAAAAIAGLLTLLLTVASSTAAGADETDLAYPPCPADTDIAVGFVSYEPDDFAILIDFAGDACTLTACVGGIEDLFNGVLDPLLGGVLGGGPTVDELVELGVILPCDLPPPPPPEPFFAACETGTDVTGGIISTGPVGFVIYTPWEFFETLDFSLPCTMTECTISPDDAGSIELPDGIVLPCPEPQPEPEPAWQPGDGRPPWAVTGGNPSATPGRDHVTSPRNPIFSPPDDGLPTTG